MVLKMAKRRLPPSIIIGLAILLVLLLVALFAEELKPYEMNELFSPYKKPDAEHLLGTNDIGQDILSELIIGARVTLMTGTVSAFFIVLIGTAIGVAAGYIGGALDKALSAVTAVFMAIPSLPFTIVLVTFLKPSVWNIVIALCLTSWTSTARVVRSKVAELKEQPFIKIEEAFGQRKSYIMLHHILPNISELVLMRSTLAISSAMLTEASISFLGLGVYNQKSWGGILYYAFRRNGVITNSYWWYLPPIICISLCIFAFILIGYYGVGARGGIDRRGYSVQG
jgi:peptide/nickel transport system permease protein